MPSTLLSRLSFVRRDRLDLALSEHEAIIRSSNDAVITKTLEGSIVSWNPAAESLYGYTEEEVVGRHISVLVPPGQEDEVPRLLELVARGERVDHHETVRRRKDGTLVDVSLSVFPVQDATGNIRGAAVIARDITEPKRREQERAFLHATVERERATLEAILAGLSEGVIILGREQRVRYANERAAELVGAERGSLVDRSVDELLDDMSPALEEPGAVRAAWARVASQAPERWHYELTLKGPPKRNLLIYGYPIERQEEVPRFALFIREVTEERRRERLRLQADRWETITNLTARFAHELLNPLGALMNVLFLLRSNLSGAKPAEAARVQLAEREAMRIHRLVRDLLAYAEPVRPRWERVHLEEVAQQALDEIVIPPSTELRTEFEPGAAIIGDSRYLTQAIHNLLENAIEAMPRGGELRVAVQPEEGRVLLRVSDTGPGIPAAALDRIFDALYTTKAAGGFGLGLSATRSIVEAHRGEVEVQSEEGKGSTFTIRLPAG